jgi:hypothetical protein
VHLQAVGARGAERELGQGAAGVVGQPHPRGREPADAHGVAQAERADRVDAVAGQGQPRADALRVAPVRLVDRGLDTGPGGSLVVVYLFFLITSLIVY